MKRNADVEWFIGLIGVLTAFAVAGLLQHARSSAGSANVALLLAVVVVVAGILGGHRGGVTTAVGASLSYNFFHTAPIHTLRISAAKDIVTVCLLAVLGVVVGQLSQHRRRSERGSRTAHEELRILHETARICRSASIPDAIAASTVAVRQLLGAASVTFESTSELVGPGVAQITHAATIDGIKLRSLGDGLDLGTIPILLEVGEGSRIVGHLVIVPTPGHSVSLDARTGAVIVADQLATALAAAVTPG